MAKNADYSTLGLLLTLVTIILYYMFLKPVLSIDAIASGENYQKYSSKRYKMMGILFGILVLIHMILNTWSFQANCGGTILDNMGKVFASTFVPWFLIFGGLLLVLIIFPGFKGAFSNVIGYYAVARGSTKILVELLGNRDVEIPLEEGNSTASENSSDGPAENKTSMRLASDAILKLVGNTSILINQITPENFIEMWNMLTPLMKKKYQTPGTADGLKSDLLENVVLRDNIGEFCWYMYTVVLLMVVVSTMMMQQECVTTVSSAKERAAEYDNQQENKKKESSKQDGITYTG
jgi:hypothetical protein